MKNLKQKLGLSLAGFLALSSGAFATTTGITVPTPDYTDFYKIVGMVLGVAVVVMLARKGKGFIR